MDTTLLEILIKHVWAITAPPYQPIMVVYSPAYNGCIVWQMNVEQSKSFMDSHQEIKDQLAVRRNAIKMSLIVLKCT